MVGRREGALPFLDLGLHEWLARSCAELGMREPMPIQRAAIPAVLSGRDVIGRASTGSGKTAAFALPILQRLSEEPYGVFALVLTPTRELAVQISEQVRALGELMRVRCEVVVGGADMIAQASALSRRPHVVIGTPGRLLDHLRSGHTEASAVFGRLRVLVLDEADRLLDLGFGAEIAQLLERLPPSGQRQTLLFSATITASLRELQAIALRKPLVVDARHVGAPIDPDDPLAPRAGRAGRAAKGSRPLSADGDGDAEGEGGEEGSEGSGEEGGHETEVVALPAGLSQYHLFVPLKVKDAYLVHALRLLADAGPAATGGGRGAIVFTSTCVSCELLTRLLLECGFQATSLHSLQPQRSRIAALQRFRSHLVDVLVATDIAARGLDVPAVSAVLNYNVPAMPADYVHRVGRTARAGRKGLALTLVSQYEVERFLAVEKAVGRAVPSLEAAEGSATHGREGGGDDGEGPPPELRVRESAVLRCLQEVSGARRAAMLHLTESGFMGKAQQRKARRQKEREAAAGGGAGGADNTGGSAAARARGDDAGGGPAGGERHRTGAVAKTASRAHTPTSGPSATIASAGKAPRPLAQAQRGKQRADAERRPASASAAADGRQAGEREAARDAATASPGPGPGARPGGKMPKPKKSKRLRME